MDYVTDILHSVAFAQDLPKQIDAPDVVEWAQRVVDRTDDLIGYVVTIGSIAIGVLIALFAAAVGFGYIVAQWHWQHNHLLGRVQKLDALLDKRKNDAELLAKRLNLPYLVDLKLDDPRTMMRQWIKNVESEHGRSIDEIDGDIHSIKNLIELNPEIYLYLGHYYRFKGHESEENNEPLSADLYEKALRRYGETLQSGAIPPKLELAAHQSRAVCFERLQRYSESLNCASKAVAIGEKTDLNENDHLIYDSKGIALKRLGRHKEAIEAAVTSTGLTQSMRAHYNLACFYAKAGDSASKPADKAVNYTEALAVLEKLSKHSVIKQRAPQDGDFEQLKADSAFSERFAQIWR